MDKKRTSSNFGARGWGVIIFCALTFFIAMIVLNTTNVYIPILSERYGMDATLMTSSYTFAGWASVLVLFIFGKILTTASPRRVALCCAVIFGLCTILWGRVNTFWQFLIALMGIKIFADGWQYMSNMHILANWFPKKRGLAMGWATFGITLGAGVGVKIFNSLANYMAVSSIYLLYGLVGIAIAACGYLVIRDRPEELGRYPDNNPNYVPEVKREEANSAPVVWTARRTFTTKEFWFIAITIGVQAFCAGFMVQIIPRFTSLGFSMDTAANLMLGTAVFACLGSYICGLMDAAFGTKRAILATHGMIILMAVFAQFHNLPCTVISLLFMGTVMGGASNYVTSICMECWGEKHFRHVFRYLQPVNQAIGASGAAFIAVAADVTGSYDYSFLGVGCLSIVGVLLLLSVKDGFAAKKEATFSTGK